MIANGHWSGTGHVRLCSGVKEARQVLDSLLRQAGEQAECGMDPLMTVEVDEVLADSRDVSQHKIEAVHGQW